MKNLYSNLLSVFLCFFAVNFIDAQCVPSNYNQYYSNNHYISNVTFGSINNSSGAPGGSPMTKYSDFTGTSTSISPSTTYPISITVQNDNWQNVYVKVWIDYNNDGDFDDVGETVFSDNANGNVTSHLYSSNITIPASPTTGNLTMRVATRYNSITSSCDYGGDTADIQDYTVLTTPSSVAPSAICQDISVTLDSNGNATIAPSDIDNGSSDDNAITNYAIDIDTFDCSNLGPNTVTLTVTDGDGQTDTCTSTVTVNSYTGSIVAPILSDVNAYCSYTVPVPANLSYKCNTVTPVYSSSTSGSTTFTSSGTITWLYDDGAGQSTTATQNVNINTLVAPSNVTSSTITDNSATISWDDLLGGETYNIRYREKGTTVWMTTISTSNSVDLTSLNALIEYDVEVASVCGASESAYSATHNFITLTSGAYCTPAANTGGVRYISNVTLPGETVDINNNSGDGGGYTDFTSLPAADLYKGNSYDLSILIDGNTTLNASNHRSGWVAFIDYDKDGIFSEGERIYRSGGTGGGEESDTTFPFVARSFTVPATVTSGVTVIRIGVRQYWSPGDACSDPTASVLDYEDYKINISLDPFAPQDIIVTGNNSEITNGQTTTTYSSFTDFGIYDINGGSKTRVFKIQNNGSNPLVLGATPVVLQAGSSSDFSIISQPASGTSIASGAFETFSISFDPSSINNNIAAVVVIDSNDPDENPFTFNIVGEGDELYPDTDGDGISNNVDIDDDNDGIADGEEQLQCLLYSNASVVETEFLNEDFGFGTSRSAINGNTDGVTTSYCYEDGAVGQAADECDADLNLNDGEYVVHYSITNGDSANNTITPTGENIATFGHYAWFKGEDHTPGDTNGRMAVFNAAQDPGVFYETAISGILPNVPINYSFWAINIDNADSRFSSGELPRILPNITVKFMSSDYSTEFGSFDTGDITRCTSGNNCVSSAWKEYGTSISINDSEFVIQFINNAPGGNGNDLAIDDILITQSLCDLDNDGVADVFDLDNDNDGIPNIIEFGNIPNPDPDFDATVAGATWIDTNGNGMHDLYEGLTALNSDNDNTPDYLDLDSDNDAIFDNVEYDGKGDLDVSGDGASEGTDADTGIANDEFDNDGLLGPVDGNDDDGDNDDHGSQAYALPLDSDGDLIPDYLDPYNDLTGLYDIDTTQIYAHLDTDNDGVIDGSTDTDIDGILDGIDTNSSYYGSPRDLSDSYTLFFDGRNDYVEDANVINAWANASLMAWIKIEPGATGERVVVGQNSFRISITNGGVVKAEANGVTLEDTEVLQENIWVHVGATYNSGLGEYVLYVNGHPVRSTSVSGSFSADASNFTIGRTPNTDTYYFQGEIDEVRLFNEALSETAFQRMVYQELSSASFNQGAIVPLDIDAANTFNTSLIRYFKMDTFKGDIVDDAATLTIDVGTGAKLYNIKNIYFQTAPLPYETTQLGDWSDKATWLHGDVWDINNEATNQDWSIVHVKHDLTTANRHGTAGLIVDAAAELSIQGGIELYNSWYLNLAGLIDLEGESQLVQTQQSVLEASGSIERDQQGTENLYTYNYWSSPVHSVNPNTAVDGDETYTVASVLKDGEDPDNPAAISFVGGYDGDNTSSPIEIANYWIWKFEDNLFSNYYAWQQIKSTGVLKVGEGYTMKGPGTGSIATDKNYVFEGKPNNGIIELPINAGNASLVGNPYPSAIDANQFIADNTHLDGALYFWEHYGGGSHILKEYQGGYATYNLSGGAPAVASVGVDQVNGTATKIPAQFVPVGQGFYVKANSNGDVTFNNGQRVFMTEASSSNSLFVRGTAQKSTVATTDTSLEDLRTKFRVNYNSPNGYVRQLLTTIDENASIELDRGYDASLIEEGAEDMFWMIGENSYVIQGIDQPAETTTLPLSVKTKTAGEIVISLAELKYPTEGFELYLKDNLTETYHDLLENPTYTTSVEQGITANRFEIVFAKQVNTLSVSDNEIAQNAVGVYYDNTALHITNPNNASIEKITGNNILGQSVLNEVINSSDKNITLPANLALGIYIFTIETDHSTITKKMIIN